MNPTNRPRPVRSRLALTLLVGVLAGTAGMPALADGTDQDRERQITNHGAPQYTTAPAAKSDPVDARELRQLLIAPALDEEAQVRLRRALSRLAEEYG